jgi:hypothetical protein
MKSLGRANNLLSYRSFDVMSWCCVVACCS